MTAQKHFGLLIQSIVIWFLFWLGGLPHYYQQYSTRSLAIGCTLLSVAISLAAVYILLRSRVENRKVRAFWCSVYYTATFLLLDALYCGLYLGHGAEFLARYWYLTVFYVTPWLTFLPTEYLLRVSSVRGD